MDTINEIGNILDALSFAVNAHGSQRRKGGAGEPYIAHLIEVARLLWQTGGIRDTDIIIAGILHDTVEDTYVTRSMLLERFGERITDIVCEVTDDNSLPKQERRRRQVDHASELSHEARLIKLADKISNIGDIIASPPVGWSRAERLAYVRWGGEVIDRVRGASEPLEQAFDALYRQAVEELQNGDE